MRWLLGLAAVLLAAGFYWRSETADARRTEIAPLPTAERPRAAVEPPARSTSASRKPKPESRAIADELLSRDPPSSDAELAAFLHAPTDPTSVQWAKEMLAALQRRFVRHEAVELTRLYFDVRHKVPKPILPEHREMFGDFPSEMSWAEARELAKAIVGEEGFKLLISESKPPEMTRPEDVADFILTKPRLVWFYRLKQ